MPRTLADAFDDLPPDARAEALAEGTRMIEEEARMREAITNAARALYDAQRFMTVSGSSMTIALSTATGKVEVASLSGPDDLLKKMLEHAY